MTTRRTIPARELTHGTVIVDARDGQRLCAVFDIEHTDDAVIVHTAVRDQERGVDRTVRYDAAEPVTVAA